MLRISFLLLLAFWCFFTQAQDSTAVNKKRLAVVGIGNGVAYGSAMTGLYQLWYKDYPQSKFHFFNDNDAWMQMDKVGHAYSCYYEGVVGIDMLEWAGMDAKKAAWIGGSYGLFIQTSVEIFDGFSKEWGASPGDIYANIAGTALVIGQHLAWEEQRIWMKYSFSQSPYSALRPNVLGDGWNEAFLKDYNGQTYWLSANLASFLKEESKFPPWLNLAIGYGIDGFVGGSSNLITYDNGSQTHYPFIRQRQWYLSPDIDLTRIPVKNRGLQIAFKLLNSVKFPMPTLSFDQGTKTWTFHPIYF